MRRSHLTSVDDPAFTPHNRLPKATAHERLRGAVWLALVAVALLPLLAAAQVELVYLGVPATVALASRWLGQFARVSAIAGIGLLAGVGAAGMAPSAVLFYCFAGLALVAALGDAPRGTRTTVVVTVIIAVLLVHRVLARAGWSDEEAAITQLATGCAACAVAAFAVLSITRYALAAPQYLTLAVGVCAALAAGRIAMQKHAVVFPRSVARALDLTLAPPNPAPADLMQLERLQNAGFRDAGLARAGVLLGHDADPATLRNACFLGFRGGQLAPSWAGQIALGDLVCRATSAWPEVGAAMLERALGSRGDDADLVAHLRGDILMEAGLIAPSVTAYEAARAAGDLLATSDAVRGLLDRGRVDEARALAKHAPARDKARARLAIWQGDTTSDVSDAELTAAWNELADFTSLTPLSRRGVTILGSKGRALSMVNADARRGALEVVTDDVTAYGVHLPLPPKRIVPGAMSIDMATRLSYRIDLHTSEGVISFNCGLGPDDQQQRQVNLNPDCAGAGPVHIEPAKLIGGEVSSLDIVGIFSAFRLSIDEATP